MYALDNRCERTVVMSVVAILAMAIDTERYQPHFHQREDVAESQVEGQYKAWFNETIRLGLVPQYFKAISEVPEYEVQYYYPKGG